MKTIINHQLLLLYYCRVYVNAAAATSNILYMPPPLLCVCVCVSAAPAAYATPFGPIFEIYHNICII